MAPTTFQSLIIIPWGSFYGPVLPAQILPRRPAHPRLPTPGLVHQPRCADVPLRELQTGPRPDNMDSKQTTYNPPSLLEKYHQGNLLVKHVSLLLFSFKG